jgi:hypothetical protein
MNGKKNWIILLVVLLVVVVGGMLIVKNADLTAPIQTATGGHNGYQAVFLVNNQVYFGKLTNENSQFVTLTDIYYLQVNQQIQPAQKGQTAANNPQVNLIKLGGELHGPTDEMRINRDQVLLIEDLRSDSNVVKAIENYKASQPQAVTQ